MNKILISSCLLGCPVRYDGQSKPVQHPIIEQWQQQGLLVSFCPEVSGGLSTPRPAAEIQPNGQVLSKNQQNMTDAFNRGAELALALCQQQQIRMAILKQTSPSCGSTQIYDGSFSGNKIAGEGITCQLLRQHGISVFCEQTLDLAAQYFQQLSVE